jgi:hypothetical protein
MIKARGTFSSGPKILRRSAAGFFIPPPCAFSFVVKILHPDYLKF